MSPTTHQSHLKQESEENPMCMGQSLPHPGRHIIEALEPGDEVKIATGAGTPATTEEVVEVIFDRDLYSALTISGRVLTCEDGFAVTPTGVHYDNEAQYPSPVTDEARRLKAEADFKKQMRTPDNDWQAALRQDLL